MYVKNHVLLHCVGQHETTASSVAITTNLVTKWMDESRQASNERLRKLCADGLLERAAMPHRANAVKYTYQLSDVGRKMYNEGLFRADYRAWLFAKYF